MQPNNPKIFMHPRACMEKLWARFLWSILVFRLAHKQKHNIHTQKYIRWIQSEHNRHHACKINL